MSCIQFPACKSALPFVNPCKPDFDVTSKYHFPCPPSLLCMVPEGSFQLHNTLLKLKAGSSTYRCSVLPKLATGAARYQQSSPVCLLFGFKGKSKDDNVASPWKALQKATGNLKNKKSIEDVLREQIERREYYDGGGSGRNRPRGGGGGSGGSDGEGLPGKDELLQVIFATIGLIFLYFLIIEGEGMTRLAIDIIKFLFQGQKSRRLQRAMEEWGKFYQMLTRKQKIERYQLERVIIDTPTWWDSPEEYKRILSACLGSRSYQ